VSLHVARLDEAVEAVAFVMGWAGGWAELTTWHEAEPRVKPFWVDLSGPGAGGKLARLVRDIDERWSAEIRLSLPRRRLHFGTVSFAGCLWAMTEGTDQTQRLERFRPEPTLVLREGSSSRRTSLWLINRQLDYPRLLRANRRLAYRLRAVQKAGDPDELRVPMPGACLRKDRARPIPVVMERLDADLGSFTVREMVGKLRDPPEANWWEKAKG
jgi:hypothetical protein